MKQLSMAEQLMYTTVRIECEYQNGNKGSGTGFFFSFNAGKSASVPLIITNKHVVNNVSKVFLVLSKADNEGNPINKDHFRFEFQDFNKLVVSHPDANVDLCAFQIAPLLNILEKNNQRLFFRSLEKQFIPTQSKLEEIDAIENILMIGYPNGIWDSVNNFPILRSGSTATHPCIDYNGKKEFLIDIACFPGSSGSPVLIYNNSGYTTKQRSTVLGSPRIIFMGVLYALTQYSTHGEIKIVDVPAFQQPITLSNIPNNIGIVIKSELILDFEKIFVQNT